MRNESLCKETAAPKLGSQPTEKPKNVVHADISVKEAETSPKALTPKNLSTEGHGLKASPKNQSLSNEDNTSLKSSTVDQSGGETIQGQQLKKSEMKCPKCTTFFPKLTNLISHLKEAHPN